MGNVLEHPVYGRGHESVPWGKRSDENDVSRQGAGERVRVRVMSILFCASGPAARAAVARHKCGSIANETAIVVLCDFFDFSVSAVRQCRLPP